ncbi:MAG: L,D-transpeptidase [Acidimicrobiales bacterium]|jgi:lipoprotein-anchoring transpeptidase ErfK/SrfK|nr:L,D-transpeptidase [Acidimicrobiales bacterium]
MSTALSTAVITTRSTHTTRLLFVLLVPLVALVAACGGSTDGSAPTAPIAAAPAPAPAAPAAPASADVTRVARPMEDTPVFAAPGDDTPTQVLPATSEFGSPLALVVVEERPDGWLRVQLPTRPNESTGWIDADGVAVREVTVAVHVDVAARRLTVTDAGVTLFETPVAVGAPATPTPVGRFFVVDKLVTPDPSGAYGPFALGLSAHSDVLTDFAGGDGQVGIHGTDRPDSIGRDVSNGCVRVPNDIAVRLDELLPLGTPVVVS